MKPDPSKKIGIHPLGGGGAPKMDTLVKGGSRYLISAGGQGPELSTQKTRNEKADQLMAMSLKEKPLTAIHHSPDVEGDITLSEFLGDTYSWEKHKPKHYTTFHDEDKETFAGGDLYTTGWYDEKRMKDILERNKVLLDPDAFIRESLRVHYDAGTPKEKAITEAYGRQDLFEEIGHLKSGKGMYGLR